LSTLKRHVKEEVKTVGEIPV